MEQCLQSKEGKSVIFVYLALFTKFFILKSMRKAKPVNVIKCLKCLKMSFAPFRNARICTDIEKLAIPNICQELLCKYSVKYIRTALYVP